MEDEYKKALYTCIIIILSEYPRDSEEYKTALGYVKEFFSKETYEELK